MSESALPFKTESIGASVLVAFDDIFTLSEVLESKIEYEGASALRLVDIMEEGRSRDMVGEWKECKQNISVTWGCKIGCGQARIIFEL